MKTQQTRIAAYGIIQKDHHLLLCRLSKQVPQWQGYWTLPGGGIDFGEHPEAAMIREVKEETGLTVTVNGIVGVDSRLSTATAEDFHAIRLIYAANYISGELEFEKNGTTDQCAWFSLSELESLNLVDLTKAAIKLLDTDLFN